VTDTRTGGAPAVGTSDVPPQTGEEGTLDSPLELSPPDWKQGLRRAVKEFKADRGALTAAGLAYYWFLAIFPAILAAVGILGLINASPSLVDKIVKGLGKTLPGDTPRVLGDAISNATRKSGGASAVAGLVGIVLALWSATSGMVALQIGLGVAYDVEEDRTFVKARVRALLLSLATLVLGGAATAMLVFAKPLGGAIRDHVPFSGAFIPVWTVARLVLALLCLVVLMATFYYLAPNRESPRWTWVSPGGILAAAIWLLASFGFSFYVSSLGSYAKTYGSLTGVVLLLIWLYLTGLAVVVGGELNAELERQAAGRARPERGRRRSAVGQGRPTAGATGSRGTGGSRGAARSGGAGGGRPAQAARGAEDGGSRRPATVGSATVSSATVGSGRDGGGPAGMAEWSERMRQLRRD
jgi:membrane protein